MNRLVPILAALAMTPACQRAPSEPRVAVEEAVVTLPAVPGRPGAAYFTLRSNRDGIRLTGVTSPRIGRIELHETMTSGTMSGMRPLASVTLPGDAELEFAPGGRHAMLFDIDPALRVGDRVTLTLTFDPAPPATVEADVRGPGGVADDGH